MILTNNSILRFKYGNSNHIYFTTTLFEVIYIILLCIKLFFRFLLFLCYILTGEKLKFKCLDHPEYIFKLIFIRRTKISLGKRQGRRETQPLYYIHIHIPASMMWWYRCFDLFLRAYYQNDISMQWSLLSALCSLHKSTSTSTSTRHREVQVLPYFLVIHLPSLVLIQWQW